MDIEKIVRENIEPLIHMSLGTVHEGKPWVCEVHFSYDEELNLYFRSTASRRHSQEIAANPNVAGSIVQQIGLGELPLGVYFEGMAKMLEQGAEQNKAFECIKQKQHANDDILDEAKREDGVKFYKISIENWYVFGKFGDQPMDKYKLVWNGGKR